MHTSQDPMAIGPVGPEVNPDRARPAHETGQRPTRMALLCDRNGPDRREIRAAMRGLCDGRVDPATIGDAQLVASELVTNALMHGAVGIVTLDVAIDDGTVTVSVTSSGDASRLPPPERWLLPEEESVTGRGLGFTRQVSNRVETHSCATGIEGRDVIGITAVLGPR